MWFCIILIYSELNWKKNEGKIFLSKAWCILAYCVNYTLKNIKILPNFIPKDREGIRKERLTFYSK